MGASMGELRYASDLVSFIREKRAIIFILSGGVP